MHEETIKNIIQESFGKINAETIAKIQERYEKEIEELKETLNIVQNARNQYAENCRKLTGERDNLILDKRQLQANINILENKYFDAETNLRRLEQGLKKAKDPGQFQEYFTIRKFNEKYDIKMPSERASVLGKQATKLSQEKRVEIKKIPDWQYGEVNSYREDVLLFVYAEEIKKSTNKLFGREKQILENYEKMMNPLIIVTQLKELKEKREADPSKFEGNWELETQEELDKREMRRDLREFLFTNYLLNDKNFYVRYFYFVADYNHPKNNKILGKKRFKDKELVEEMKKLGYEKKRKRVFGTRQQVFMGLKSIN